MFGKSKRPEEDIKKLSRAELLEMLIEETREAEELRKANQKLTSELAACREDLNRAASLQVILERLERIAGVRAADLMPHTAKGGDSIHE